MQSIVTPFYQKTIQSLPFGKRYAAAIIGYLLKGRRISAVVNQAKLKLNLQENIQRSMFVGSYEPTQTKWFKECVGIGNTFFDIGASFGYYTTLGASIVGETGKVFAFEPSPIANQVLEDMITSSLINNIVLTKAAVGKTNGYVDLFLPTTSHLHSPSIMQSDQDFLAVQVPVITLDAFEPLKNVGQIKLIKIDVEGYEPDVLDGMEYLINAKRIENIFCEFNSWWLERNATSCKQLLERFLDFGFEIHRQTKLQTDLSGHKGIRFDLQDIWFKYPHC